MEHGSSSRGLVNQKLRRGPRRWNKYNVDDVNLGSVSSRTGLIETDNTARRPGDE